MDGSQSVNDELISHEAIGRDSFPGVSAPVERRCCCLPLYIFPRKFALCGHWEIRPLMPALVASLALGAYAVLIAGAASCARAREAVPCGVAIGALLFLFLLTYARTICEGPGYFPFYWSYARAGGAVGAATAASGVVSTDAQYQWTLLQSRPPRSKFFSSARRYVFQPDHYCGWASTWIGKTNVKFFALFNFYGALYLTAYVAWGIRIVAALAVSGRFAVPFFLLVLTVPLATYFLFLTVFFCMTTVRNSLANVTRIEKWNGFSPEAYAKGDWRLNLADFFGRGSVCCYVCPTRPFPGQTLDELAEGVLTYDEVETAV